MASIILTTESALEEYAKRISAKIDLYNKVIVKWDDEYSYNSFLQSGATRELVGYVEELGNILNLIRISLSNTKKKIHVVLDMREIDMIHRDDENYEEELIDWD